MPAAGEQGDEGRLQRGVGKIRRRHVAADVVGGDEGHPQRVGVRLGKGQPHQQRPHQPRPVGGGDGVDLLFADARLRHGALHGGADGIGMGAGGDLGHDAAVLRLFGGGRYDHVGEQLPAADDGGGGLVARAFDAEDDRRLFELHPRKAGGIVHGLFLKGPAAPAQGAQRSGRQNGLSVPHPVRAHVLSLLYRKGASAPVLFL